MSRLTSPAARRVAVAQPKNDMYVTLLAIALGALVIACGLLAHEMHRYNWSVRAQDDRRVSRPVAPATFAWNSWEIDETAAPCDGSGSS